MLDAPHMGMRMGSGCLRVRSPFPRTPCTPAGCGSSFLFSGLSLAQGPARGCFSVRHQQNASFFRPAFLHLVYFLIWCQDLPAGQRLAATAGMPHGMAVPACLPQAVRWAASSPTALPGSPRSLGRASGAGQGWVRVGALGSAPAGLPCRSPCHPAHELLRQEVPSRTRPENPHFFLFFSSPVAGGEAASGSGEPRLAPCIPNPPLTPRRDSRCDRRAPQG